MYSGNYLPFSNSNVVSSLESFKGSPSCVFWRGRLGNAPTSPEHTRQSLSNEITAENKETRTSMYCYCTCELHFLPFALQTRTSLPCINALIFSSAIPNPPMSQWPGQHDAQCAEWCSVSKLTQHVHVCYNQWQWMYFWSITSSQCFALRLCGLCVRVDEVLMKHWVTLGHCTTTTQLHTNWPGLSPSTANPAVQYWIKYIICQVIVQVEGKNMVNQQAN